MNAGGFGGGSLGWRAECGPAEHVHGHGHGQPAWHGSGRGLRRWSRSEQIVLVFQQLSLTMVAHSEACFTAGSKVPRDLLEQGDRRERGSQGSTFHQNPHEVGEGWPKGEGRSREDAPSGKGEENIRGPTACPRTSAITVFKGRLKLVHIITLEDKLWYKGAWHDWLARRGGEGATS